jgi:hypothetical protein
MLCTVDFGSRVWRAICRILQCVPSFGFVPSVLRTNCATRLSAIGRGRPGRNSSCNPDASLPRNRRRHLPTVALVSASWRAICRFVMPEAFSKIILTRLNSPAGRDREFARPSSCSRYCGLKTNTAFGGPIAISTPILHWRCLYSEQDNCPLLMGQNTSLQSLASLSARVGQGVTGTLPPYWFVLCRLLCAMAPGWRKWTKGPGLSNQP